MAALEVRSRVREVQNAMKSTNDTSVMIHQLREILRLMPKRNTFELFKVKHQTVESVNVDDAKHYFMKNHYANFAYFLLDGLDFEVVGQSSEFTRCLMEYFIEGNCEDSLIALTNCIDKARPGFKLNKYVSILEEFLRKHRLYAILFEQSALTKEPDMSMVAWKEDGRAVLWEPLISGIASLPERMANKLRTEVSEIFLQKHYIPLLISDLLKTLMVVVKFIRMSRDCNLEFVSQLVGKLCLCGHAETFWQILLGQITGLVRKDYIWSRIIERIVCGVPDRCMESVLVPLIKSLSWYGLMDRFLGNCVAQKQKIRLLLCTKLIFHRYFKSVLVLQNVVGYLATATVRHHLFVKLLMEILQVWCDQSHVMHTSYEQHFYITQAIFVCMAFISEEQKQELKDEILRLLMPGVQTHLANADFKKRHLGMAVAEVVTATVDPNGPKLKFEYEKDDDVTSLKVLLLKPEDPQMDDINDELSSLLKEEGIDMPPPLVLANEIPATKGSNSNKLPSDLDSDDDLEPYDMSADTVISKTKPPKYIRDCMEGLISCDNADTLEACLSVSEALVRKNPDGLQEISAEFSKVLLHLGESYGLPQFTSQRFNTMVALAVTCPKQVAEYLTDQFYDRNYSIRQRLDIIEVIGTAAQELSKPPDFEMMREQERKDTKKIEEVSTAGDNPESWRDVVQQRIDRNTRRFGTGPSKPLPIAVLNRFASVAGYFFYPLMKNFDRQESTFDLMGEDSFVLGRLLYTLGIVMYAATNILTVRQMASCLLEFIWVLRFHKEPSVRQGLLFAVSMVYLAVPPCTLLGDLQQEVFESKNWLEDVIDKDVDTQCKTLAVQALVLLENIIKKEFLTDAEKTLH